MSTPRPAVSSDAQTQAAAVPPIPEVSGRRFLLWFALPALLLFAILFAAFKPDRPLGGPSSFFSAPDFFVEKVKKSQPGP